MRVRKRKIGSLEEEQVILEYAVWREEFENIHDYVLKKGKQITVYKESHEIMQIKLEDIFYFEAVGEFVFAYGKVQVYEVKMRLYQIENSLRDEKFIRASKSVVINVLKIASLRPALNGRFCVHMENGEDVILSRQFAKNVKNCIMKEL